MIAAVILAAGESRRMGSPKALLRLPDGRLFIQAVVELLTPFAHPIAIVTGAHHDGIAAAVASVPSAADTKLVRNPDPARGQLSSLWVGMAAAIGAETEAVLMTLVDVPTIAPATVGAVLDAWRRTRAPVVRPAVGERHGHPVVFDRSVFDELRAAPLDVGAKAVIRAHARDLVNVPVDDQGCLTDVDTPDDYRRLF